MMLEQPRSMGNVWGGFEVFKDDVEQLGEDGWALVKVPAELLWNDWKVLTWAWHNPLLGMTAVVAGGLGGSVVLAKMPGDLAYAGPLIGMFSGGWSMYWLSNTLNGQTPPDWSIVSVKHPDVSAVIADFTKVEGFLIWTATKPWRSNSCFLGGATVGWLLAPDFPMSAVALGCGIGGVALGYTFWNDAPATSNPPIPAPPTS